MATADVSGGAGASANLADGTGESLTAARRRMSLLMNQFIAYVQGLVADMIATFPADPVVDRVKTQVTVCANIKPNKIVANIGAVLYSFHKKIYARDENFFLRQTFAEVADGAVNKEHAKSGMHIANRVKAMYKELPVERREAYLTLLADMTDTFLEISALARKLEAMR